jgi:putative ABC transport system permease protein
MALGASGSDLLRTVLARGLALTLAGIALGAGLALELTRLMGDLLYHTGPRDPACFASAFIALMAAALAASFFPGLRAARTDPARALRE